MTKEEPALTPAKAVSFLCDLILKMVDNSDDYLKVLVDATTVLVKSVSASIDIYKFFAELAKKGEKENEYRNVVPCLTWA